MLILAVWVQKGSRWHYRTDSSLSRTPPTTPLVVLVLYGELDLKTITTIMFQYQPSDIERDERKETENVLQMWTPSNLTHFLRIRIKTSCWSGEKPPHIKPPGFSPVLRGYRYLLYSTEAVGETIQPFTLILDLLLIKNGLKQVKRVYISLPTITFRQSLCILYLNLQLSSSPVERIGHNPGTI